MLRVAKWGACFLAAVCFRAQADSCIWFAAEDSIQQVQASNNQITRSVPLREANHLVMNANDCGVWVLSSEDARLMRFNADGALEREIRVRDLDRQLDEVEQVALDPYDESLWLANEARLVHLSSSGQVLASIRAPGSVRRFRIALDQSLWVLGRRDLWHFDSQGTLLAAFPLARHFASEARHLELDSVAGLLWLAGEHDIAQMQLSAPATPILRLSLRREIDAFTLDPVSGSIWVVQERSLLAYGRDGRLLREIDLRPFGIREPERLAFDPSSSSLWVASEHSLNRFTPTGQFVVRLNASDGNETLGVPTFRVDPTLSLLRPPQNALTNNAFPPFTLTYGAQCNDQACPFTNDYFSAYQLSATLNRQPIGTQFLFDAASAQANFTPATRLPEGPNSFSAQVKDSFGHLSNTVTNGFTVDTIPPRFLTISPPEGSVLGTPNVAISGTIDDATATVVLTGLGSPQKGPNFSFPVVLQPGPNTFLLSAVDPAGNVATSTLHLALMSVTITNPANGATINSDSVTVSGILQGPANTGVTVNGIPAAVSGNSFVAVNVPLQLGANTLTASATTPNRQTATQTLSVTSTGPAPLQVVASPAQGVAAFGVTFTIRNRTGNAIQSIRADYTGTGTFVSLNPSTPLANNYTTPGTYRASFIITDSTGVTYNQTVTVVALDPAVIDQTLRTLWGGFTTALASRDTTQALQYFNAPAQAKYGPVLNALRPNLPQIVGSYRAPQLSTISDGLGEYVVGRTINGVNQIFFIYFLRDVDGVWRMDSM